MKFTISDTPVNVLELVRSFNKERLTELWYNSFISVVNNSNTDISFFTFAEDLFDANKFPNNCDILYKKYKLDLNIKEAANTYLYSSVPVDIDIYLWINLYNA